jgi:uncharacterized protein (UPF0276 family)
VTPQVDRPDAPQRGRGDLRGAVGVGLRIPHYRAIFEGRPEVDFFEIISENFMVDGGPPLENLGRVLERYPVVQHGVSLGIASADPLDRGYLRRLRALAERTGTPWFTDHLCWCQAGGRHLHDLLPVPYTRPIARYVAERAREVQDRVGLPFALENLSSYVEFADSTMTEWQFLAEVVEAADVGVLLDVNNIYVSAVNHGFDALDYLDGVPWGRVVQLHLAGHSQLPDGTLLDTHDHPVRTEVWALYREVIRRATRARGAPPPTLLEWDAKIPAFEEVHAQALLARGHQEAALAG